MNRKRTNSAAAVVLALALLIGWAWAGEGSVIKDRDFYTNFDNFLKSGIERSGGSLDKGRYHFVIGLSTSHFSSDQQHAMAMTKAAQSIMNTLCVPGDKLTCFAWEQDVWDVSDTVTLRNEEDLLDASSMLPKGNKDNSQGGHDTYRALTTIISKIDDPESTIIVMMTNSHESRGETGSAKKTTGKDNEEYKAALEGKGFSDPKDRSFQFDPDKKQGGEIFVTAVFPKELKSIGGGSEKRIHFKDIVIKTIKEDKENLPSIANDGMGDLIPDDEGAADKSTQEPADQKGAPATEGKKGGLPILWIIVAAAVVGAAAFMLMKGGKGGAKTEKPGEKLQLRFDGSDMEIEVHEGEVHEIRETESGYEAAPKKPEGQEPDSGSGEDGREAAPAIMEISYEPDAESFVIELKEGKMATDADDLGEIKECGESKYMIRKGYSAGCSINYKNDDRELVIG